MIIKIRDAQRRDAAGAFRLIQELAEYEKAAHEVTNTIEQFEEDGFGPESKFFLKVAIDENNVVRGIALYYNIYSTWKGSIVYLDDLVVEKAYRKLGIGKQLLDAVMKESVEKGANQFRFHVLDWNEPAINFYKKYPFSFESDWITVKLEQENFKHI